VEREKKRSPNEMGIATRCSKWPGTWRKGLQGPGGTVPLSVGKPCRENPETRTRKGPPAKGASGLGF